MASDNIIIRKLALPQQDWQSVLKGAGIAVLGAAVTYLSQNIANADFGQYSYVIVPLVTVALNVIRKVVLHDPDAVVGLEHKSDKPEPQYRPTKEEYTAEEYSRVFGPQGHQR